MNKEDVYFYLLVLGSTVLVITLTVWLVSIVSDLPTSQPTSDSISDVEIFSSMVAAQQLQQMTQLIMSK